MISSLYIEKVGLCPVKWSMCEDYPHDKVVFCLDAKVDIAHPDNRRHFFQELYVWCVDKNEENGVRKRDPRTVTVVEEEEDRVIEFKGSVLHSLLFTNFAPPAEQEWYIELEIMFEKVEYCGVAEYCKRE